MTFHIAYACNDAYIQQTIVSMVSLFEHNRMQDMVIYLVEDCMCRENIALAEQAASVYHQKLMTVPLRELLGDVVLAGQDRHPDTIYAKLFLNRVCMAERILYLDSDTVVTGPLLPLWEMDLEGVAIAGVRMPYSNKVKKELGLDAQDIYVCDGVLLIHLKKWREDRLDLICRDFIRRKNGQPFMWSEGVVNYAAKKQVRALPAVYNLMSGMLLWNSRQMRRLYRVADYYTDEEIREAVQCPVIIHYLNELYIRPWYANSDHPKKDEYRYYRLKAGFAEKMPVGKLKIRTKAVRYLNAYLPFGLFLGIYRMVKIFSGIYGKIKKQAGLMRWKRII